MNTNALFTKIKEKNWHFYVARKFNWFVQNTQILTNKASTLRKHIGFDCSQDNYLILNGDEYYTDEETEKFNSVFENKFQKDGKFFEKFAKKECEIVKKVKKYINKLKSNNFYRISNKRLSAAILEFQRIYTLSFVPAFSRPDEYLEAKLKEEIKKRLKVSNKETESIFSKIATYPSLGKLAYTEEPLELLKLAKLVKSKKYELNNLPKSFEKKLLDHIDKYSWMKGAIFVENLSFTKEEYLERLTNLLTKNIDEEISRIKKSRKKDDANYKKIIKKYNFDQRLQLLVEAVRNFIFLRTFTTEASDKLLFITRNTILEEAAKRLNLSSEEIVTLSSNEIVNLLTGNMQSAKSLINKRQRGYAIVWVNGNNFIKFGKEATKLQKSVSDRFKIKKDLAKKKAIKGTPASLGKVKGVVKVLSSHEEVGKVHKGDILVTSMTTPDYIFAMEKAAAFVTDEGGITCHAAIVAREFGVPCIVGTINTTKLLKDGNLVEVNANKGIVTILN